MVDEAKLCSVIQSTSETLVVQQCAVGPCGEDLGPFCGPMLAGGSKILLFVYLFGTFNCFWRMTQLNIDMIMDMVEIEKQYNLKR